MIDSLKDGVTGTRVWYPPTDLMFWSHMMFCILGFESRKATPSLEMLLGAIHRSEQPLVELGFRNVAAQPPQCHVQRTCALPGNRRPPRALALRQLFDRQLRRALRLLEDLLDVSRLNRDASVSDEEPIYLADLVGYEATELQDRCGPKHTVLTLDMPPAAVWVLGSRLRLSQVIGNLLDNSAKHSPIGGGILVQLRREAGTCGLRVRDGGVGIRSEDLPHIFDPFFRGTDPSRGRPVWVSV